jgi:periplasmic protein TonB
MFESVLRRGSVNARRSGAGAAMSVAAHLCAVGALVWLSTSRSEDKTVPPEVTFFNPAGTGAPGRPPPKLGSPDVPVDTPKRAQKSRQLAFDPNAKARQHPSSSDDGASGEQHGDPYGDPGGSDFGGPGGTPGAGSPTGESPPPAPPPPPPPPTSAVIPFGPGMERPHKISGPEPAYTREAREAHVEGKMLVQCVIGADGKLSGCTVLKHLAHMDQAVLSALAQQRWAPATVGGQPVSVTYTIPFRFTLKK